MLNEPAYFIKMSIVKNYNYKRLFSLNKNITLLDFICFTTDMTEFNILFKSFLNLNLNSWWYFKPMRASINSLSNPHMYKNRYNKIPTHLKNEQKTFEKRIGQVQSIKLAAFYKYKIHNAH